MQIQTVLIVNDSVLNYLCRAFFFSDFYLIALNI